MPDPQPSPSSPQNRLGDPVAQCPLKAKSHVIEVLVVDSNDKPVADCAVELRRNEDEAAGSLTGPSGMVRFVGLDGAPCKLSLYQLDPTAWESDGAKAIPQGLPCQPPWESISTPKPKPAFDHEVEEGESVSQLSERFGIPTQTIWSDPANQELSSHTRTSYVLNPGDKLHIPERGVRYMDVSVDKRYRIKCRGAMEILRVRYLNLDKTPRSGAPYLLRLVEGGGLAPLDRTGNSTGDGVIEEFVPASLSRAELLVGPADDRQCHIVQVGYLDPVTTIPGVQARLDNLGYYCTDDDGTLGPATRMALEAFQIDNDLDITGVPDSATQDALRKVHRS